MGGIFFLDIYSNYALPSSQTGSVSWTFDVTSGCLGALTPGNKALVRDQATGLRLGPGELGEICVKTMTCMKVIRIMMRMILK